MSVIIPNMKMPMSCLACPLAREMFNCLVCVGYFKDNLTGRRVYKSDLKESDADFNRPDWCPLVPLPAGHGRLGDLDKLDYAFTALRFNEDGSLNHWDDRKNWCLHGNEIETILANAPTIVPAEGGNANGNP